MRGWLKGNAKPLNAALGNQVRRVETFRDAAGAELYYVVYLQPAGFVIVAGDDLVEPIICFAPSGVFDPSDNNALGALVSRDIPARVARVRGAAAAASGRAAVKASAKWRALELAANDNSPQPQIASSVSDVRIAPLTHTTWDQATAGNYLNGTACYNYYTPPFASGSNSNYFAGCVATCMAQLMFYYKYPVASVGTASFSITVDGVPAMRSLRGGDGSGGPYLWADMPLSPPMNPPVQQCQAIGALVADAGVSVNMDYTASGSSSVLLDAKNALTGPFQYSNAIQGYNQNNDLGTNLIGMLNPDLDAHTLALLGIQGAGGGHAVVVDGYGYDGATLYHHLNLGWSGTSTAWYTLPLVDTANGTFTVVDQCVYNVFTNGSGEIISGRILDQNSSPVVAATVTATRVGGGTFAAVTDTNGIYALTQLPSGYEYSLTATKAGYNSATGNYWTGTSSDNQPASGNVWGANFALSSLPTAVDHFSLGPIGLQSAGTPFSVTLSALNSTNGPATAFSGTVAFSATGVTAISNVLVGDLGMSQTYTYGSDYTDGYRFTPNTNIQVVAVRAYFGTKVSIWDDAGTLLASQTVTNQPGTWVETPLSNAVTLSASNTYRVGVYFPAGTTEYITYYIGDWPTNFANGSIGQNLYYGFGDSFPNNYEGTGIGPFLDLRYTIPSMASLTVAPAISGAFTNGAWNGTVSVLQPGSNVVLKADDGAGHIGLSNPFTVRAYPLIHLGTPSFSGGHCQFSLTGGNAFEILASSNLVDWTSIATMTNSTGTTNFTDPENSLSRRFYRAQELP